MDLTIYITIGSSCIIGLDDNLNLITCNKDTRQYMNLGPLTQQRAREISEYLQRLAIHTPEK